MDDTLQQIISKLPVFGAVVGLLLIAVAVAWRLGILLLQQYRLYLDEKFETMEERRASASIRWEQQFSHLKELISGHDKQVDNLDQRLTEFESRFIERDRFIHTQQMTDARFLALARRLDRIEDKQVAAGGINAD